MYCTHWQINDDDDETNHCCYTKAQTHMSWKDHCSIYVTHRTIEYLNIDYCSIYYVSNEKISIRAAQLGMI